jgi:two-component system KDP operon response regulator KdpE
VSLCNTVRRYGNEIHLTPLEFELPHAFLRHRGRLVSHRTLLTEVWGPGHEDDAQVLRTHVANLRRKIERPGNAPRYVVTEPGVGYRFAA